MPARPAQGASLAVGAATDAPATAPGSDTFTAIAQVTQITGPAAEKAEIETTPLSATAAKEFIAGIADSGSLEFTINFDGADAQHQLLQSDAYAVGNSRNWQLTLSDSTVFDIVGEVTTFNISNEVGAAVTAECAVKISGAPTPTYAT